MKFRVRSWGLLFAVGVAAAALALGIRLWLTRPQLPPEPPLPDLSGVDEEVGEIVQQAREKVHREPSSSTAWGQLGEVLLAHEFNREANRCFQQAELLDPQEPAWPYLQGLNLIVHDPEAGIPCLERAVRCSDARQAVPRLLLAEALLERDRLDEAQALLDQVLSSDPANHRAQLARGRLEVLRKNWRAGLSHLEACRNDGHTRKRASALCAQAWSQLGDTEKARTEQRRFAELPDDQPWLDPFYERILTLRRGLRARFMSVDYLLQAGRLPEALQLMNQTLEKYPSSLEGWMRLGEIWHRANRLDRSLACYQQATRIAPDLAEAWFRMGCVQAQSHSPEAAASFRQAIHHKPHYAQAHYNLAQCLKEQGERAAAAEQFREALRCRPDYELARTALRELESPKEKK